jgi:hypothetical protein
MPKKNIKNSQKCVKKFTIGRIALQNNELTNDNLENLIAIFEEIKRRKLKLKT